MKKIAVIIPAYRESANIIELCKDILSNYERADILIVDDSPDTHTIDVVKEFSNPQVNLLHRKTKGGRVYFWRLLPVVV